MVGPLGFGDDGSVPLAVFLNCKSWAQLLGSCRPPESSKSCIGEFGSSPLQIQGLVLGSRREIRESVQVAIKIGTMPKNLFISHTCLSNLTKAGTLDPRPFG